MCLFFCFTSTGGADGVLLSWDVSDGTISEGKFSGSPINLQPPHGGAGNMLLSVHVKNSRRPQL